MNDNFKKFKSDGYAIFGNIVEKNYINEIYLKIYKKYILNNQFEKGLLVGDKRYMLNVELDHSIFDQRIFANENLIEFLYKLLGKSMILESFGIVFSLPGARHQGFHRDGSVLFDAYSVEGNASISGFLPPYAITLAIPLINIDEETGRTEIKSNTHRYREDNQTKLIKTNLKIGSALLWDFRTLHGGGENNSKKIRPIIYMTYSREWWRDCDNYKKLNQKRLNLDSSFIKKVDLKYRNLFRYYF